MLNKFRDKFLLEIVVFTSGALVMIYEVIGSRILAPYIGTSTYVWTSLIGVILASLSLGYWLGGKMADRKPDLRVLSGVMFAAAALLSATVLLHALVLSLISVANLGLELKSIIAALILFAPASVLFGFVTPYAVRLKMLRIEDAGKTVGRLYALSTVGSILGTFSAGFFLLPFVGSVRTLYLLTAILFALSLLLAPFKLSAINVFVILLLPLAILLNEIFAYSLSKNYELHDFDTEYSRIQIFNSTDNLTGKPIRVFQTDPRSTQSAMFSDSDEMVSRYASFYHLLRHFKADFQNTLIIGGAGYSFPKEYLRVYPTKKIDVVEIDAQATEIARRLFRLPDNTDMQIFHEDGRVFLNKIAAKKYDVILIDAFGSLYSIPFQLTTREAVKQIDKGLADDGVVIMNLISAIKGEGSLFLQAEYKTYTEIFPHVSVFKVNAEKSDDVSQNLILLASKSAKISFETSDAEISTLFKNLYDKPLNVSVPVLTDELAPVEYYNSHALKTAEK
jgi:spermidine synthase